MLRKEIYERKEKVNEEETVCKRKKYIYIIKKEKISGHLIKKSLSGKLGLFDIKGMSTLLGLLSD